jgi:hypothetical protein
MRSLILIIVGCWACGDNQHSPRLLMDVSSEAPRYGRVPFPTDALREGPHLGRIQGLDLVAKQFSDRIAAHLETSSPSSSPIGSPLTSSRSTASACAPRSSSSSRVRSIRRRFPRRRES